MSSAKLNRCGGLKTADFDYYLPPDRIAQTPATPRDSSRLMVLRQDGHGGGAIGHRTFRDLVELLRPGDLLVGNESRVIPARLHARKRGTGGQVEVLLIARRGDCLWEALVKPGRRVREGTVLEFDGASPPPDLPAIAKRLEDDDSGWAHDGLNLMGKVVGRTEAGSRLLRFSGPGDVEGALERLGMTPLPPYIHTPLADPELYQTVYARVKGSVAAPTAGLHFTPELIERLLTKGVEFQFATLHIGLDTFRPVQVENAQEHRMHSEYAELSAQTAEAVNRARGEGRRIVAVGTTAVRVLETAGALAQGKLPAGSAGRLQPLGTAVPCGQGCVAPFAGWTDIFIYPGYRFRALDALITNFHLPRSTLLMLVSAFAGRDFILRAYAEAIRAGYRFYSFGDAMLVE